MYFVIVEGVKYEFNNLRHAEVAYKAWKSEGLKPFIRDSLGFTVVFVDVTIVHEDCDKPPSPEEINEIWKDFEDGFEA